MSETVKLIIEIPKETYLEIKGGFITRNAIASAEAIKNGIPLDSNDSDRAEVQAYFAGEAYGWEQGRKALIDELKAEIKEKYRDVEFMDEFSGGCNYAIGEVLEILDNIGKGDNE